MNLQVKRRDLWGVGGKLLGRCRRVSGSDVPSPQADSKACGGGFRGLGALRVVLASFD